MNREVTELDLRLPEFKHPSVKLEDLEFRNDGKIVRKDRWETGMHQIAAAAGFATRGDGYEIDEVIDRIQDAFAVLDALNNLRIEHVDVQTMLSNVDGALPLLNKLKDW